MADGDRRSSKQPLDPKGVKAVNLEASNGVNWRTKGKLSCANKAELKHRRIALQVTSSQSKIWLPLLLQPRSIKAHVRFRQTFMTHFLTLQESLSATERAQDRDFTTTVTSPALCDKAPRPHCSFLGPATSLQGDLSWH